MKIKKTTKTKTKTKIANASGPVRCFATQAAWAEWLEKNHRNSEGLWLRLAKKGSALPSLTYAEALEVALCYGWIDGQKRGESEAAWLQRFLARSPNSVWSKINRDKAVALIANGRMKAAGFEAVEAAKKAEGGMRPTTRRKPPRFQRTCRRLWMLVPRRRIFFGLSTAQTGTLCCIESRR